MSLKLKFKKWNEEYLETLKNKFKLSLENAEKERICIKSDLEVLVKICMQRHNIDTKEFHEKIVQKNEQLINIEVKIEKMKSTVEIDQKTLETLSKETYIKLKRHPLINSIYIDLDKLVIITKKLNVKDKNIGHFEITYSLKNDNIRIKNLEYRVKGNLDHWHIQNMGPCFAEWKPILWSYLNAFEIFFFVDTLIHYLLLAQTERHAYMNFDEWVQHFNDKDLPEEAERYINPTNYVYYTVSHSMSNTS